MPRASAVADRKAEAPAGRRRGRGPEVGPTPRTSVFDVDQFLSTQFEGKIDTRRLKLPDGEWKAQVNKIFVESFEIGKGDRKGETARVMLIMWKMIDPEFVAAVREDNDDATISEDNLFVRQKFFLDFTSEGSLDFSRGKNIKLGYVREAVGQNDGTPWAPNHLLNQVAIVNVHHTPNDEDPDNPYAEVNRVAAL